jgi:hypothetical protein
MQDTYFPVYYSISFHFRITTDTNTLSKKPITIDTPHCVALIFVLTDHTVINYLSFYFVKYIPYRKGSLK